MPDSLKQQIQSIYKLDSKLPKLIDDPDIVEQDLKEYYVQLQILLTGAGSRNDDKKPIGVEQIFDRVEDKSEAHKVLITGGPGVGKSTFMHYLSYKWGEGGLWNGKFDFIFRVRLKNLSDDGWEKYYAGQELRNIRLHV